MGSSSEVQRREVKRREENKGERRKFGSTS